MKKLKIYRALAATACVLLFGCALSGKVVDSSRFETSLHDMRLEEFPALKVYHGGVVEEIPLRGINSLKIDPSTATNVEDELFYSAEVLLSNGSRITSQKNNDKVFVSVQNTLCGKSKDEKFRIGLENISQISITR